MRTPNAGAFQIDHAAREEPPKESCSSVFAANAPSRRDAHAVYTRHHTFAAKPPPMFTPADAHDIARFTCFTPARRPLRDSSA